MAAHAPRRARTDARMLLPMLGWDGDVYDATLALSELVTNAYRHANTAGSELKVRLAVLTDGTLLLEVSDPLPGFIPRIPNPERGRGLPLLDQLAKHVDWYLHGDDTGKTVRALLAV
ncbi:ATP-binding protein [Streptomyces sp. NPDC056975]|uniref:ATP-binding protein n=1 Tax=Streptomyces sp. NPDC056975 TaxID=3345985 RepID=UPI0036346B9E